MRSPDNARAKTRRLARSEVLSAATVLRGFLAESWDGKSQTIKVRTGAAGQPAVLAKAPFAGKLYNTVPAGTACTLRVERGALEVMSIDTTQQGDILSGAMRGISYTRTSDQTVGHDSPINVFWTSVLRNDLDFTPVLATANLSSGGTVNKTNGSTTITGSGTRFLDDLSPGTPIRIPGGSGTQYFSVVSIESQTSMTVRPAATSSASGQTAQVANGAVSIPYEGWWFYSAQLAISGGSGGTMRIGELLLNGSRLERTREAPDFSPWYFNTAGIHYFQQYDLLELTAYQDSGGNLSIDTSGTGYPILTLATMAGH